jgi:HAD superfamily hydrolase (TIGR01509 family)
LARAWLRQRPPLNPQFGALAATLPSGLRTALVTGSSRETAGVYLDAIRGVHTFDAVVTAESVTRGKPAPDPYVEAARQLDLSPDSCWALEDSLAGTASASAAGMLVVHLSGSLPCQAKHDPSISCVASLADFGVLIERVAAGRAQVEG